MKNQLHKSLSDSAIARWGALLLISMVMFATYYFYDVYSSIKSTLQAEVGLTNADYGAYYGAYSFTNSFLLMAFLGGIILDRWGIRKTGFLFISIILVGTSLTAYGASNAFKSGAAGYGFFGSFMTGYSPELKLMIFGRLLFGLGAETFYVTLNKIIAKWFKGKELALAFAINVSFGRFGTAAALVLSPAITTHSSSWTAVSWFGVMLVVIAFIAFIVYMFQDFKFDKKLALTETAEPPERFRMKDLMALFRNRSFIYIVLLCVTFYSAVFPFIGYAPDFLLNKYGLSEELSGLITTILPMGTVIFTPIFGWWCDHRGKSASIMILGSLILILVHLTFSLTTFYPYIPLFLLGVAFSLVPAAMWPSVAKIVDSRRLGSAYGLMFTIQNYGLMLFPFIIGVVLDKTNQNIPEGTPLNYQWAILLMVSLGVLGIIFAFLLKREDKTSGFGLELPNKKK